MDNKCEACGETKDLHLIGGTYLCLLHADTGFSSDTTGEKLPDPDGIEE